MHPFLLASLSVFLFVGVVIALSWIFGRSSARLLHILPCVISELSCVGAIFLLQGIGAVDEVFALVLLVVPLTFFVALNAGIGLSLKIAAPSVSPKLTRDDLLFSIVFWLQVQVLCYLLGACAVMVYCLVLG